MLKKSFKIDSVIYSEDIINRMIWDFSDFDIVYLNGNIEIIWDTDEEIDNIFHEAMNYLVALYNEGI